jgi:hypothetical protein
MCQLSIVYWVCPSLPSAFFDDPVLKLSMRLWSIRRSSVRPGMHHTDQSGILKKTKSKSYSSQGAHTSTTTYVKSLTCYAQNDSAPLRDTVFSITKRSVVLKADVSVEDLLTEQRGRQRQCKTRRQGRRRQKDRITLCLGQERGVWCDSGVKLLL